MEAISQKWFQWARDNNTYSPHNLVCIGHPYSRVVSQIIEDICNNKDRSEATKIKLITRMFDDDRRTLALSRGINIDYENYYFITFNFDHRKFNLKDMYSVLSYMSDGRYDWIIKYKGVFEFHRRCKETKQIVNHPHIHFIMKVGIDTKRGKVWSPKKLAEKLFRIKDMKNLIGGVNFIDVDPFEERHVKYIRGDKCEDKLPLVQMDVEYRNTNNIPHMFVKE